MVAIMAGAGLGLLRSSGSVIGSNGLLGQASLGRAGDNVYLNAANGNLLIQNTDEVLLGIGIDDRLTRTYNSLGSFNDPFGTSQGWAESASRKVSGLTGTVNTNNSSITLTDWDGSDIVFNYDKNANGGAGGYTAKEDGGAFALLSFDSSANKWTYKDGTRQVTDVFDAANGGRILSSTDNSGNKLSFTYDSNGLLTTVTTQNGEYTTLTYNGSKQLTSIVTNRHTDAAGTSTLAQLTRVYYTYDTAGRLSTIKVDLTPEDNSTTDGNTYVTTYGYDGTSNRVSSISETDGSSLAIGYTLVGSTYRVTSLTQTAATGVTRQTTISYDLTNKITTITDPQSNATQLAYDSIGRLLSITAPPAVIGGASQITRFSYDTNGDVLTVTEADGTVVTNTYDSNGNVTRQQDSAGNVVTRTYGANNELLTETRFVVSTTTSSPTNETQPQTSRYFYDSKLNLTYVIGAAGDVTQYVYNTLGQRISVLQYTSLAAAPPLAGNVSATINGASNNVVPLGLLGGPVTSVQVVTLPTHGTITYNASHTEILYTPASGYSGADNFTYTATNANGTSATATVSLTVQPPVPAIANPIQITVNGNSANDPIPANLSGGTATGIRVTTAPSHGTATISADGTSILYTPTAGYGGPDTLQYVALNGSAPASAPATVSINVLPGLTANNQMVTTLSGVATTIVPAFSELNSGYTVKTTTASNAAHGTTKVNRDGTITYTSTAGYVGADSFQFTLNDGNGGIVTATVNLNVQSLVHGFATDVVTSTTVLTPITVAPTFTDSTAQIISVGAPKHGNVVLNSDGTITYSPEDTFVGSDSFTYTAKNSSGVTVTATIIVRVYDAPLLQGISTTILQNTATSLVPNFSDPNGLPASITAIKGDTDETGNPIPIPGTVTIGADGQSISYTPPTGFTGFVTFRYVVSDGVAPDASALVIINVTAPPATPAPATATTTSGTTVTFKPSVVGTITAVGSAANGRTKLNADGSITYTPDQTFIGIDSFTYTVNNSGTVSSSTATIAVYDPPSASSVSVTGQFNTPLVITPTIRDPNGFTATITRVIPDLDQNGNIIPLIGSAVVSADGKSIVYTPRVNFGGTETFRYVVSDGQGPDTIALISVKVTAPLATPLTATVGFNSQNNAITPSGPPGSTLVLNGAQPLHGTVSLSGGTLLYTPTAGYSGPDSFQYAFNSPVGTSVPGLVSITVNPAAPVAANVSTSVNYGSANNFVALGLSGAAATSVAIVSPPQHGTVTIQGTSVIYTPDADYFGSDVFEYSARNAGGTSTVAQVQMLVRTPPATTTFSTATIDTWMSANADKSGVNRTDTAYDFRGNVASVTTFGRTLSSGVGDTTSDVTSTLYVYDQFGNLLKRQPTGQPQNATAGETFVYDGLGRTISSTDVNGGVTRFRFNDAQSTTVVTLANNLTRTSTYNLAGELISYSESSSNVATSTVSYKYDSLGRLRIAIDATGQKTFSLFDNVGRKTADIQPDGTLIEYVYNSANLVVETIHYNAKLTSAQLASLVDANGNPTNVTITSVRPVADTSNDRYEWMIYDNDHRLVETVDASGAATVFVYDGKSRLISTTKFANRLNANTVAGFKSTPPIAIVVPAADQANDRVVRTFYDAEDRLVGTLDAEGFLTRTIYDGAGQKIETVAYASAVKASLRAAGAFSDLVANVTASANANDIHNWFLYDQRGLLRAAIDGEGDVTRYHYDALANVDQKITGQKLDPASLLANRPTLAFLPAPSGSTIETTTYTYNLYGQVLTETLSVGGVNRVTVNSYDSLRRLTSTTVANGTADATAQTIRYDDRGRVTGRLSGIGSAALAALGTGATQAQIDNIYATYGTRYVYDGADRLVAQIAQDGSGAGGLKSIFYYDADGRLVYAIDPLGEVIEYRYDTFGERADTIVHTKSLSATTLAGLNGGFVDSNATTAVQGIVDATDADSHSDFNTLGEVADTKDPLQATTTFIYDSFGEMLTATTPLVTGVTVQSSRSYDRRGLLLTSTADSASGGLQLRTINSYDAFGRLTLTTDPSNRSRAVSYDRASRVTQSQIDPNGQNLTQSSAYDANGNVVATIDATGKITRYVYDASNRQIYSVDATGDVVATTYDNQGRVASVRRYVAAIAQPTVDGWPRAIAASDVTANVAVSTADLVTTFTYDKDGRVLTTTVGNPGGVNLVTTNTYDNRGLLVATTDAAGGITRFVYDSEGRQIFAVDATGRVTGIVWDSSGRTLTSRAYAAMIGAQAFASLPLQIAAKDVTNNVAASANDEQTNYVYDADGRLRYKIDAAGRVCEYVYDLAGNMIRKTEYATAIVAPASYTLSSVQSQLAPSSGDRTTRYVFDTLNRAAFVIDAAGGVVSFAYDGAGNIVKTTEYAVGYSVGGDPTLSAMQSWASTNAGSTDRISRSLLDSAGRKIYGVDAEGFATEFGYDNAGRVTRQIKYPASYTIADGAAVADLKAQLPTSVPPDGQLLTFTYDGAGRLTDSFDGAGVRTHYAYDGEGRAVDVTVAFGTSDAATTHTVYDAAGRVSSTTMAYGAPEAATTSYDYDGMGRVKVIHDALTHTTTFDYDAAGRIKTKTAQIDASTSAVTTTEYDVFGNVAKVTDPNGNSGFFYYDKLNRQVLEIDPQGYATATAYSRGDQAISVTHYVTATSGAAVGAPPVITANAKDEKTQFGRDRLDRLTSITDAEGFVESYGLNAFGDRTTVTNKLGGVTTNIYDRRGRLISETLPINSVLSDGTVEANSVTNTYTYDARGNLIFKVKAAGLTEQRTTAYTYDKADRLFQTTGDQVQVVGPNLLNGAMGPNAPIDSTTRTVTPTETRKYDSRGNLIEIDDANGAKAFAWYDDLNRKIADLDAVGTLRTFTYDANGNARAARVYGDRVAAPAVPGGNPPAPVNSNNFRETTNSYDFANRLTSSSSGTVLTGSFNGSSYSTSSAQLVTKYVYDRSGNVVQQTDPNNNSSYSWYDKRGKKIAQLDAAGFLTAYDFDQDGNVLTETRYATRYTGTVSLTSQPTVQASSDDRITKFTYDKNGRRLTEARQNVTSVSIDNTGNTSQNASTVATITYTYNGLGEVTSKTEATGDATNFFYDAGGRQILETSATFLDSTTGKLTQRQTQNYYDGLNNLTLARVGAASGAAPTDHFTHYNYGAGGRLASTVDAAGFSKSYVYDAVGNTVGIIYDRLHSDGSTTKESQVFSFDALGRSISQGIATFDGSTWTVGDRTQIAYDAYGEVVSRGIDGGTQETFAYDGAGRLSRSTQGDGIAKLYLSDANGNQTLAITSAGADLSGYTSVAAALAAFTNNGAHTIDSAPITGVDLTINTYDARNMATEVREPFRELSMDSSGVTTTAPINTRNTYNAFGEVTSQTDAKGNITSFVYNTMGKIIQRIGPKTSATDETGAVSTITPTENDYYDASGRLVAVTDANGHSMTRQLLAGSGYGGSDAVVIAEFHADGGAKRTGVDVFGDARTQTNELGFVTNLAYDGMDRLIQVDHAARDDGSRLSDFYMYDNFGQRIVHYNNQFFDAVNGTAQYEKTDYDAQGRVVSELDFGGHTTTYSYVFDSNNGTPGLGTFGGWTKTTINSSGLTSTENDDYFNRIVSRLDFGGRGYIYNYDAAGRLAQMNNSSGLKYVYTYFNTGRLSSVSDQSNWSGGNVPLDQPGFQSIKWSNYSYDADGNRLTETLSQRNVSTREVRTKSAPKTGTGGVQPIGGTTSATTTISYVHSDQTTSYENATATYDELNRITSFKDTGIGGVYPATILYEYDAVGNKRHVVTSYNDMTNGGTTQDFWYRYDSLNRFVVTQGQLSGDRGAAGTFIGVGATGTAVSWDRAGQRRSAVGPGDSESYDYYSDGYLQDVKIDSGAGPVVRAIDVRDLLGRVTSHTEYTVTGATAFSRSASYDNVGNTINDAVSTRQSDGSTLSQYTTYSYYSLVDGTYQGGAITDSRTDVYKNNSYQNTTDTRNLYVWWDSVKQQEIDFKQDINKSTTNISNFVHDIGGNLTGVFIHDGNPRQESYTNDLFSQVIDRTETNSKTITDPHEHYYYFNGIRVGDNGNNGPSNTDYATAISDRSLQPSTSNDFKYGGALAFGDFSQSYVPIDPNTDTPIGTNYTATGGETLQSLAQAVWGDSGLWYLIADANGLKGSETLVAGQALMIPNKVSNVHSNSTTFEPYDPNQVLGDVQPTTPQQIAHKHGCGIVGMILLVVIAVAVTVITSGALAAAAATAATGESFGLGAGIGMALGGSAAVGGVTASLTTLGMVTFGAIGAAAGSIVSQGIGVATGLQDKFSWAGVGLAALGAAVGGAIGGIPGLNQIAQRANPILFSAVKAGASDLITQGIGVAGGLQDKFDWAGVGATAAAAGATTAVSDELAGLEEGGKALTPDEIEINRLVSGMAGTIASSTARTLIDGSDFGDNLAGGLANFAGQTIGNKIASELPNIASELKHQFASSTALTQGASQAGAAVGLAAAGAQSAVAAAGLIAAESATQSTETNGLPAQLADLLNRLQAQGVPTIGAPSGAELPLYPVNSYLDSPDLLNGDPIGKLLNGVPFTASSDDGSNDQIADSALKLSESSAVEQDTPADLTAAQKKDLVKKALQRSIDSVDSASQGLLHSFPGVNGRITGVLLTQDEYDDLKMSDSALHDPSLVFNISEHGAGAASFAYKRGIPTMTINVADSSLFNDDGTVDVHYLAADLAHEARHFYDEAANGGPRDLRNTSIDEIRSTERNAYRTEAAYNKAVGATEWALDYDGNRVELTKDTANYAAERSVRWWVSDQASQREIANAVIDRDYARAQLHNYGTNIVAVKEKYWDIPVYVGPLSDIPKYNDVPIPVPNYQIPAYTPPLPALAPLPAIPPLLAIPKYK